MPFKLCLIRPFSYYFGIKYYTLIEICISAVPVFEYLQGEQIWLFDIFPSSIYIFYYLYLSKDCLGFKNWVV